MLEQPIKFKSIVIETTNICNASCMMCYQDSSPKGSKINGIKTLPLEKIKKILKHAISLQYLDSAVHFAGGETFLHWEKTLEIIKYSKKLGFLEISATTNGFWAKNNRTLPKKVTELKNAGLSRIELSFDYWHNIYIEQETIENCIIAFHEVGLPLTLRLPPVSG